MTAQSSARQAASRVAVAVTAGLLAAGSHHTSPQLVDPASCAAAPEVLAVMVARIWPHVSPFKLLLAMDTTMFAISVAILVWLVWSLTNRLTVAVTIAAAVAFLPSPMPVLRPLSSAALLVGALWCGLWLPDLQLGSARGRRMASWILLAVTAAFWPSLTVVVAALWVALVFTGAATEGPRRWFAVTGAIGIAIVSAVTTLLVPSPSPLACVVPSTDGAAWISMAPRILSSLLVAGPYVLALAALGVFTLSTRPRLPRYLIAAGLLVPLSASSGAEFASPLPLFVWLTAAAGLAEMIQVCRPTFGGRLAAVALVLLVPALQWQVRNRAASEAAPDYGHVALSLAGMNTVVGALPAGAALVSEDASTDVLLRALGASAKLQRPSAVPDETTQVSARLAAGTRVFALPRAQAGLQSLGIQIDDTGVAGLAELHPGGDCRVLGADWRVVQDVVARTQTFAMVSRTADEAGPVVIYGAFMERPVLDAASWPVAARRGFYTTVYDQSVAVDRDQLDRDIADDRLPPERFARAWPYVARLELWRTPIAPLRLSVGLGQVPTQFVGRVIAQNEPRRMTLCPAFPHNVKGLNP